MEREIDSDFQARNIVYVYHRRELEFCQYDVYLAFFVKVSKWKKKNHQNSVSCHEKRILKGWEVHGWH